MEQLINKVINRLYRLIGSERIRDPFKVQESLIKLQEPIIFDVGAHVGSVSMIYMQKFPNSKIYSFEPFPASFVSLKEKAKTYPQINPQNIAISDKKQDLILNINSSSATNSILPTHQFASLYWGDDLLETKGHILVPAISIDQFCKEMNIQSINILKIDVQGAEYSVLAGAQKMLS